MQEQKIFRQIEKDLLAFKELRFQEEMERDSKSKPTDARSQQEEDKQEFAETINDLAGLSKCFWRLNEAEGAFKQIGECFKKFMDRKDRQIMLYEE